MGNIKKENLLLYAVTDRAWLKGADLKDQVEAALKGGAGLVQLREKNLDEETFLKEAVELKELCSKYHVPLLINDNIDICIKSGADGVHVGQSDMEAMKVREMLGPDKIIGVTAKTPEQARKAEAAGADYLGSGALFATGTKTDAKVITPEELKNICASVSIPVVGIGGLSYDNIDILKDTGVCGAALVSAIFAADDIEEASKKLKAKLAGLLKTI